MQAMDFAMKIVKSIVWHAGQGFRCVELLNVLSGKQAMVLSCSLASYFSGTLAMLLSISP